MHAAPLSILATSEEYIPWLISNYIQIATYTNFHRPNMTYLDFFISKYAPLSCPWLKSTNIMRKNIETDANLISFLVDKLNEDYYIRFYVNEYYISESEAYLKYYHPHPLFIYGYDSDKEIFYIADFLKDGKFAFSQATFIEMKNAFFIMNEKDIDFDLDHLLYFDQTIKISFNTKNLIVMLQDYLNGETKAEYSFFEDGTKITNHWLWESYERKPSVGISLYERLIINLQEEKYDLKAFAVLADHKKVLYMLCTYLHENNHLANGPVLCEVFYGIQQKALVIRNLLLKTRITKNNNYIKKSIDCMTELKFLELIYVKMLIDNIQ